MEDSLSIGDCSVTSLLVLAKSAMELCVLPLDGMCVVVGSVSISTSSLVGS